MAAADYNNLVQELYIAYFGRPADVKGLADFSTALSDLKAPTDISGLEAAYKANSAIRGLVDNFSSSAESLALYGANSDTISFVSNIFINVLNRAPTTAADKEGLLFWVDAIDKGGLSRAFASSSIMAGALANKTPQGLIDGQVVLNKIAIASNFTAAMDTAEEVRAYSIAGAGAAARDMLLKVAGDTDVVAFQSTVDAALASLVNTLHTTTDAATTFVLTTGLDNQTANQFFASQTIFNVDGKGPTLNTGDKLFGSVGRTDNSLTVTDLSPNQANGNIPAGVTLSNIQNVTLNSSGNTSAGTGFSTVGYADVRNLTVVTNGDGADIITAKNGENGTVVNVNHNGFANGTVDIIGGTDVNATTEGGTITVGTPTQGVRVPLATEVTTGTITIHQQGTGAGGVRALGGTTVNVDVSSTSNNGAVNVGNTAGNTGNNVAGKIANASGDITITSAGTGAITSFGGVNVVVTDTALSAAGAITVGDVNRIDASNQASGTVTITETAQIAYNGLAGSSNNNGVSGAIGVFGGTDVSITTNAANAVNIGNLGAAKENTLNPTGTITVTNTGTVNNGAMVGAINITGGTDVTVSTTGANITIGRAATTAGAVLDQVSNPSGNVVVTETKDGNGFARDIVVDGGNDVTVNAKGQSVAVGTNVASAPKGAVTVTQSDMLTGTGAYLAATRSGNVTVDGGTTVTVNTTGGNVTVGGVVGGVNTVPSDAVTITRTFSGAGADATAVQGGTTVGITTTKTSGAITVGAASAALNVAGTALKDANLAPTGDVTIVDATTVGAATVYGTGAVNVNTNGAQTVSITGGNVAAIADVQSTLATGGSNSGKAIGTSTLKTVVINGLQGNDGATIASDALAAVSVLNSKAGANAIAITNNTAAHDLKLTIGGDNKTVDNLGATASANALTVTDDKAGTITINDNGTASTAVVTVNAAKATAVTVSNSAAASLQLGAASTDIAKVTLTGAGNVSFAASDIFGTGNLSKALVVDATAATGNVSAAIQATTTATTVQQYLGGSGADTVTINSNASGWGALVKVDGGTGTSDVLVANYDALGTDVALGNAANVKNFEILRLGALASNGGNYDASGFAEVQVGAVAGNVAVINTAASATLSVTADTGAGRSIGFTGANNTGTTNALTVNLGTSNAGVTSEASGKLISAATGAITANGIETITVNAIGGYTAADPAKSLNVATINDTASNGAATLVVGGTKSLTLTSNAGFTSVDASTNTGTTVDVTAAKVSNVGTTFTGGAAVLKAAGSNDTGNFKALVTLTGTATNNFLNNETAVVTINGATYTYTSIGNNTAATVAGLLAAAITNDATTNNALGNVVKGGAGSPAVTAVASGGNIVLTKNAAFEVGTSETGTNATIADAIVGGQQQIVLEAGSAVDGVGGNVTVTFAGGAGAITVAVAANDTTAQVATKIAAGITAAVAANKPGVASAVVVDSTKVLVTLQSGEISQVAIGGNTGYVGAGVAATDSVNFATVNNQFVTGTGGGEYTAGLGGSWNAIAHKYSSGSETVTLDASTAKADTLKLADGAVVTDNGTKGGVTKFVVDSQSASDVMTFTTAGKTILANATTGVVNTVNGAAAMAAVLDSSGALNTALANLTYVISNGVITFGATGGNSLSQFTVNQLINAAQILVSSTTTGGADKVTAFSYNGRSYVVASDNAAGSATLASNVNTKSIVVELKDVASVKGFGTTFGEGTIVVSDTNGVTNITGAAKDIAALATSSTLDYTGFAKATLQVPGTTAANTNTTKFTNLAASAELVVNDSTAGADIHVGLLETTQVGASGHNSLTVTMANNATIIDKLTVSGDALVKFATANAAQTVTELVDATNTVNTIKVTGDQIFTLLKETGTALTTIDSTLATGKLIFGSLAAPDAHNALTIKLAVGAASDVWANGTGDNIAQVGVNGAVGTGVVTLIANGSSDIITLSNGNNVVTANGAGDVITVGTGSNTITATGANDVFNIASGAATTVTVGTNATLNIGTANLANGGAETIKVFGAAAGGASDSFALTTINFAAASGTTGHVISFDDGLGGASTAAFTLLGGTVTASQVNVATAASLTEALDMAANYTLLTQVQGASVASADLGANAAKVDWFQFGGDTYIVAMVNDTGAAVQQTALNANDIVVKITGMVDLSGSAFGGEALTLA